MLSAYIRLAEVGIGCQNWPDCYAQFDSGEVKKGITVLTEEGRDMAHYGARVAHRYIATVLGLFIVAIFVAALVSGRKRATGMLIPGMIFAVTVFLSLLGYYTPSRTNPLITMGNLLGGMALLGLLWWLMQREACSGSSENTPVRPGQKPLALLALCLVLGQVVLGGWSSANYASANCPDLLACQGSGLELAQVGDAFNPFRDITLDAAGQVVRPGYLGWLSMVHRLMALITAGYLAWLVRKLRGNAKLTSSVRALSIFSIGQVVVGVTMIWLQLPLLLVTAHNLLAAGLLLSSINLLHQMSPQARFLPPD